MMRAIFTILFCLMVLPITAHAADNSVFRNFVWGVSPQDVRDFEDAIYMDTENGSLLFFEDKEPARTLIKYDFTDNKLWRIEYQYLRLHLPSPDKALDFVIDEQAKLSKRLGKPVSENVVWTDKTYLRYPKFFSRAYGMGHIRLETAWETPQSTIKLTTFYDGTYYQLGYVFEDKTVVARPEVIQPFVFNE